MKNKKKQTNVAFSCTKTTTIDIERYRTLTFELLMNINLLHAITCDDCNCKSAEHKLQIDQIYMQLCAVLEKASRDGISLFTVNSSRDYIIPSLLGLPWRCSASVMYANYDSRLPNVDTIIKKSLFGCSQKLYVSQNSIVRAIEQSRLVKIKLWNF